MRTLRKFIFQQYKNVTSQVSYNTQETRNLLYQSLVFLRNPRCNTARTLRGVLQKPSRILLSIRVLYAENNVQVKFKTEKMIFTYIWRHIATNLIRNNPSDDPQTVNYTHQSSRIMWSKIYTIYSYSRVVTTHKGRSDAKHRQSVHHIAVIVSCQDEEYSWSCSIYRSKINIHGKAFVATY